MTIATLYNHKGGVSKTSTTFNLAHYLAFTGSKVLLVDADTQCNLTELCLGPLLVQMDEEYEATGVLPELPGTTLLEALLPRIQGNTANVEVEKISPVELNERLHLIRGSVDLTSLEDDISEAHIQRFSSRTNLMRTYVAIGDMLVRLKKLHSYDYIFIDLGPGTGAITRSCFLACDAFFIPVAPDRFNVQAIRTLSQIIDRWISEHAQIRNTYESYGLPVRPGAPIFLGAISQFFKIYKGKPKAGFDVWLKRIPEQIDKLLIPVLKHHSSPERNLCPLTKEQYIATSIPDFGTLAPLMQEVGKAIFAIEQADTATVTETGAAWGGATWDGAVDRMNLYFDCFAQLASRLHLADQ